MKRGPRGALANGLRACTLEREVLGRQRREQALGIGLGSHCGKVSDAGSRT
jgi:hypothetical protein